MLSPLRSHLSLWPSQEEGRHSEIPLLSYNFIFFKIVASRFGLKWNHVQVCLSSLSEFLILFLIHPTHWLPTDSPKDHLSSLESGLANSTTVPKALDRDPQRAYPASHGVLVPIPAVFTNPCFHTSPPTSSPQVLRPPGSPRPILRPHQRRSPHTLRQGRPARVASVPVPQEGYTATPRTT